MSQTTTAIPAFDHLPEVNAGSGAAALQRLSDEWLRAPLAKRHGVKQITIKEDHGRTLIGDVAFEMLHDPSRDSLEPYTLHFPVDKTLCFTLSNAVLPIRRCGSGSSRSYVPGENDPERLTNDTSR